MITVQQIKDIAKLRQKKYRDAKGLFVVEGRKMILDLLTQGISIEQLYCIPDANPIPDFATVVSNKEMGRMSNLKTPQSYLAVLKRNEPHLHIENLSISLFLDDIQDPGNFGTILRTCLWFGIDEIICSADCVDVYNPKVVQASMGAVCRMTVHYVDKVQFLTDYPHPVYGTFLEGTPVSNIRFPQKGLIVFGNEGNGISSEIEEMVSRKITIPAMSQTPPIESLNIAVSVGIVLSFTRLFPFGQVTS